MTAESDWKSPPIDLRLGSDEIHVWRASLCPPPATLARLQEMLSPDERTRAACFRFSEHRNRFKAGRGIQREILSRYLGITPDAITFHYSPHGKPELDSLTDRSGIRFSVSNSGGLALYALALEHAVGVDLEELRPMSDAEAIARRFFSARERETFLSLPEAAREVAFFHCWVRKEAYIKAAGEGLSVPLDQFDVAFAPGETARLLGIRGSPNEAERWTLRELDPGDGYVGALVTQAKTGPLRLFDWSKPQREES